MIGGASEKTQLFIGQYRNERAMRESYDEKQIHFDCIVQRCVYYVCEYFDYGLCQY